MNKIYIHHLQFCEYSQVFKENTKATIRWYHDGLRSFMNSTAGKEVTEVHHITEDRIKRWMIEGKLEKNWSAWTRRGRMNSLGRFLKWAVNEHLIETNPMDRLDKPRTPKATPQALAGFEAEQILRSVKRFRYTYRFEKLRAVAIVNMFLFTGIRRNELIELEVADVDFQSRTVMVHEGKGKKDRMIPMMSGLVKPLQEYVEDRNRLGRKSKYFFTGLQKDQEITLEVLKRIFKKIKNNTGIHTSPHKLRHTFATLMLEGGCDPVSLQKMMGHSKLETTLKYLTITPRFLREQIEKHSLNLYNN